MEKKPKSPRENIIAEALSVCPSANVSTLSLECSGLIRDRRGHWYASNLLDTSHASSCRELKDVYEDKHYTDSVTSEGSGAALLKRSRSMPQCAQSCQEINKVHEDNDLLKTSFVVPNNLMNINDSMDILKHEETDEKKEKRSLDETKNICQSEKTMYMKNLIVISVSLMFIFVAYMSLRNLQSSINHEGGLGLITLSVVYIFFFLGCILATSIVQHIRPKPAIMVAMVFNTIYTLANFYPRFYTLIPAAVLVGIGMGSLWTAHATYVTNIAIAYADLTDKPLANVLSQFNGIYYVFYGLAQIIGGIIASTVLHGNSHEQSHQDLNTTFTTSSEDATALSQTEVYSEFQSNEEVPQCGAYYCFSTASTTSSKAQVPQTTLYLLLSIYAGCSVLGLLILIVFLNPLKGAMKKPTSTICTQLASVFHWVAQVRVVLIIPLMSYTLFQAGFLFGDFTKVTTSTPYTFVLHIVIYHDSLINTITHETFFKIFYKF